MQLDLSRLLILKLWIRIPAFKMCSADSGVYTAKASVLIKRAISRISTGPLIGNAQSGFL